MQEQASNVLDLLWLLPTGISAFGVKFLRDMAQSIKELNINIAVLAQRVNNHEETIDDHEDRLRLMELS